MKSLMVISPSKTKLSIGRFLIASSISLHPSHSLPCLDISLTFPFSLIAIARQPSILVEMANSLVPSTSSGLS